MTTKEEQHVALVQEVSVLLPCKAQVVFLGDGEFDGVTLLDFIKQLGWRYICRTACNGTLCRESIPKRLTAVSPKSATALFSLCIGSARTAGTHLSREQRGFG